MSHEIRHNYSGTVNGTGAYSALPREPDVIYYNNRKYVLQSPKTLSQDDKQKIVLDLTMKFKNFLYTESQSTNSCQTDFSDFNPAINSSAPSASSLDIAHCLSSQTYRVNHEDNSPKRKRGRPPISNEGRSCKHCQKMDTPQWRKPNWAKDGQEFYCNACALKLNKTY